MADSSGVAGLASPRVCVPYALFPIEETAKSREQPYESPSPHVYINSVDF